MIGGHSFFSIDSGRATGAPSDQLVLRRFRRAVPHRRAGRGAVRGARPLRHAVQEELARALAEEPAVRALLQELGDGRSDASCRDRAARRAANGLAATRRSGRDHRDGAAAPDDRSQISCGSDRARFLDAVALATDADFFDPARRPRVAAHPACRQGARVPGGVHRRAGGRHPAAALGRAPTRPRWRRSAGCSMSA